MIRSAVNHFGPFTILPALGLLALMGLILPLSGCAESSDDSELGTLRFSMEGDAESTEKWFRVQLFDGEVGSEEVLFDSSCLGFEEPSFEIRYLPVGEGRSLLVEYFTGAECRDDARGSVGFRGDITIVEGEDEQPFYYVQRYPLNAVTELPEDLNVSGGNAVNLSENCTGDCLCDTDADCEQHVAFGGLCYQETKNDGSIVDWCIPTCVSDSQCQELHPNAVCDVGSPYCLIHSPFPLNMSEPRAFGHAVTLVDGDVMLAGGFGRVDGITLRAVDKPLERFDTRAGLFREVALDTEEIARGMSGSAAIDATTFALVGGVRTVRPVWSGSGGDRNLTLEGLGGDDCSTGTCLPNMSDKIVVIDTEAGTAQVSTLPGPRAQPTVVQRAGELIVLGGYTASGISDGAVRSTGVWRCTLDEDKQADCVGFGNLLTERAGAAAACLDNACDSLLVIGGNTAGHLAEIVNVSGGTAQSESLQNPSLPGKIFAPSLCGLDLVGGGDGLAAVGGILPVTLTVDNGVLGAQAMANVSNVEAPLFPSVVRKDAGCWVVGGVAGVGTISKSIHVASSNTFADQDLSLHRARYGAQAAVLGAGPLAGSVMFAGGLRYDASGASVAVVRGAEVLRP